MKQLFLVLCLMVSAIFTFAQNDFYTTDKVHEIKLTLPQSDWMDRLDSLKLYGEDVLIGTAVIDGKEYKNVGVRYRGGKSFKLGKSRNPFQIKLNHINKNQNHQGYKTLKLSTALRDPSMVREVLGYEIARTYMPAPRANHVKLYINNEYRGLFVNVQAVDDVFLKEHFGTEKNTFIKGTPPKKTMSYKGCKNNLYSALEYEENAQCYFNNYELKSADGWDDLIELTRILEKEPEKAAEVLNIDRVLWMLAFNNVLVNLSSYHGDYSQNYYLYKDNQGRFNPVVWDLNLAFGSYKNYYAGKSSLTLKELQELDPFLHADNPQKPLISKILKNDSFKDVYLAHIRTILKDYFLNGLFEKRAKELQNQISVAVINDKFNRYQHKDVLASLTKTIGRKSKIPGIAELMIKRTRFLKKHPAVRPLTSEISDVIVLKRDKFAADPLEVFRIRSTVNRRARKVRLYYRFPEQVEYEMVYMKDDGKSEDKEAGDKIFGVKIAANGNSKIEYYIVAENAAGVAFFPEHYTNKPLKADLNDLN